MADVQQLADDAAYWRGVVEKLVAVDPMIETSHGDTVCLYCHCVEGHDDECPWAIARASIDEPTDSVATHDASTLNTSKR